MVYSPQYMNAPQVDQGYPSSAYPYPSPYTQHPTAHYDQPIYDAPPMPVPQAPEAPEYPASITDSSTVNGTKSVGFFARVLGIFRPREPDCQRFGNRGGVSWQVGGVKQGTKGGTVKGTVKGSIKGIRNKARKALGQC